jgi:acetyl-CoA synthetase
MSTGAPPTSAGSPAIPTSSTARWPTARSLMFEGVPTYPDAGRFWEVVDKHKVNIFYTAPTAIRALMRAGRRAGQKTSARACAARHGGRADQSRGLGVVLPRGRRRALPDRRHLVADRNRRHPDHPAAGRHRAQAGLGHAALLRRGTGALVDDEGKELEGCLRQSVSSAPWPGQMRTVYGDHQRFIDTYFSMYKGYYFTGDGARATRTATTGSPAGWTT